MKPGGDFRQDEFEQDRARCIESIDKGLHSKAFGQALGECLARKGYEYGAIDSAYSKQIRWDRPDFNQVQFGQDTEECERVARKDLEYPKTLSECLTEKGYTFKPSPADKGTAGKVLLLFVGIALGLGLVVLTSGAALPVISSFPFLP